MSMTDDDTQLHPDEVHPDEATADEDPIGRRVRPYTITGGRTQPSGGRLPVETLIRRTDPGAAAVSAAVLERRRILELTGSPLSVAELASHVGVHLGVVQVLLGDLTDEGLVSAHRAVLVDDRPDISLLERVLHGLRAL
jgi:hypothetical protein